MVALVDCVCVLTIASQLHQQCHVSRRGEAPGGECDDWQAAGGLNLLHELNRDLKVLRVVEELVVAHGGEGADLREDRARVANSLDHVARAGVALKADHRRALGDAAERLAQVLSAAHKGDGEAALVDVVGLVGGGEYLGLVNAVHLEGLRGGGASGWAKE